MIWRMINIAEYISRGEKTAFVAASHFVSDNSSTCYCLLLVFCSHVRILTIHTANMSLANHSLAVSPLDNCSLTSQWRQKLIESFLMCVHNNCMGEEKTKIPNSLSYAREWSNKSLKSDSSARRSAREFSWEKMCSLIEDPPHRNDEWNRCVLSNSTSRISNVRAANLLAL